ncbi:MAG TPA: SGNH/GDSL hydrolase family protein [Acetobacteraceae bacterium]|nr:SGNH/GDSL hydrolase family protein [Acetobacteraceae bacterium]
MPLTTKLPARVVVLALVLLCGAGLAWADAPCPAEPPAPLLHLRHLRATLEQGSEALLVAIGSSSTLGVMASDPAHSYPAELQAALEHALPRMHIAVINRGVGGQDAPEELARLQTDVIAVRPQLVVWQVGANGALRHADPDTFRTMVTEGVERLQAAGIDVVLMDNQHSPKVDAAPEHALMDAILAQVAQATGVGLFSRSALMAAWQQEGAPEPTFISSDGLHQNDRGYVCTARALADAILDGLRATRTLSAKR